jgi:uncharacterized tellurite resistance protein B-like protein
MAIASDRIMPLCDLLLGAAHADKVLRDAEKEEVRGLIQDLAGDLPPEVDARIFSFDPKTFDLKRSAAPFRSDSEDDRKKLLVLASAVIEADEEIDIAEDEYLRALAGALGLPDSALGGLTVEIETADLPEMFTAVRKGPPPPPKKKT